MPDGAGSGGQNVETGFHSDSGNDKGELRDVFGPGTEATMLEAPLERQRRNSAGALLNVQQLQRGRLPTADRRSDSESLKRFPPFLHY
ncbi:MAG: hypothetical protein AABO58_07615 [Acidobacteriota bacterium]